MDLHIIRSEADYQAAIAEYETYFDNEPALGSPEGNRFELLGLILAKYEEETSPIATDPVEVVKVVMAARGYGREELIGVLGSSSRASEFLGRRRGLTMSQVRRIRRRWRLSADVLIGDDEQEETAAIAPEREMMEA